MRAHLLSLTVFVLACGPAKPSADEATDTDTDPFGDLFCDDNPWYPDVDGDGYGDEIRLVRQCDPPQPGWIPTGGDCDDTTRAVRPAADEAPNRIDDDCDGVVDEGTTLFDDDGDGACEDEVGPCSDGSEPGDCDDVDPERFPGAPERCNAVDDSCDGVVPADELDRDGDSFLACEDCNDNRADISPLATETCNGLDDDCDRVIDDVDDDGDGAMACEGTTAVDLLLVIDNSCSMFTVQSALAQQADLLLGALERDRIHWKVGALAADDVSTLLAPAFEADAGDTRATFANAVRPPDRSLQAERGVQNAGAFLRSPAGRAFRRPGAGLAVIFVSDEDDRSTTLPGDVADLLRGVNDTVGIGVVAGGWTGCSGRRGPASPSPRLSALHEASGGPFASVCADAWFKDWGTAWLDRTPIDCRDDDARVHPHAVERCDGLDDDCDGEADEDHDGDGATACSGDCADRDPLRRGGLEEVCDGIDNDCDGLVPTDELDRDFDGWRGCSGDCDDTSRFVHPFAVETCGDGTDQDCDGLDAGPELALDRDGDGYSVCEGDCDDDDDLVFPWAPEHPTSGRDEDCDGAVDGYDLDVATAITGVSGSSLVRIESGGTLFDLCGSPWPEARVSVDGYLIPGARTFFEDDPTLGSLRAQAPLVAAAWGDLDPTTWTGGSFLAGHGAPGPMWVIQRPGRAFTVVWDDVPDAVSGEPVRAVLTIHDGDVEIALASGGGTKLVGASCTDDPDTFQRLDPAGGTMCLADFEAGGAGSFVPPRDQPLVATSACTP